MTAGSRRLALNAERLTPLTDDDLAAVNGGMSVADVACVEIGPTIRDAIRESTGTCAVKTLGHSLCQCGTEYCV